MSYSINIRLHYLNDPEEVKDCFLSNIEGLLKQYGFEKGEVIPLSDDATIINTYKGSTKMMLTTLYFKVKQNGFKNPTFNLFLKNLESIMKLEQDLSALKQE